MGRLRELSAIYLKNKMTYPYDQTTNSSSVQMDPKKITCIINLFRKQQLSGSFPGGQMVVRRFGKTGINEHIGIARDKYG